jgi:hypothetical protein
MSETALKPLGAPAAPAPKRAMGATVKAVLAPRANRAKRLSAMNQFAVKILLFGGTGTGKTTALARLLALGKKILCITTDIGETGNLTVTLYIKNVLKRPELLENFVEIPLYSFEEVDDFLTNPAAFFPEIYDFDPDFIVWDGFSSFQLIDLQEYVGEMMLPGNSSEGESSGLQLDQRKWGMVKNATVRKLDKFLSLSNPRSEKPWHKIVTSHESLTMKGGATGSVAVEKKEPLLSGAGGKVILGGFDLIFRTFARKDRDKQGAEMDDTGASYFYSIEPGENTVAKNRGFKFTNEKGEVASTVPGDMGKVWKEICEQAGLV